MHATQQTYKKEYFLHLAYPKFTKSLQTLFQRKKIINLFYFHHFFLVSTLDKQSCTVKQFYGNRLIYMGNFMISSPTKKHLKQKIIAIKQQFVATHKKNLSHF